MSPAAREPAAHPVDRARLTQHAPLAPPVHRYAAAERHTSLVRHYWVPVWDIPPGQCVTEQVLQYPTCLVVVSDTYSRFYGVVPGRSQVELSGQGWAVGVALQPGAGMVMSGRTDLSDLLGTHIDVETLPAMARVVTSVRAAMTPDPASPASHARAIAVLEGELDALPAVSAEGREVTGWVSVVESDPEIRTVTELCELTGTSERRLQRVLRRYLGLTPKWLIQRRRLHEATDRLKQGATNGGLAELAVELGYTDQAHFTRDFHRVTGYTPGAFATTYGASHL
ncbi:MAG TPA: helix-turn-helix domain-containing protein [Ornithinimicrobium sp.]|uniref:helix-turn-helix domain-containing protein n=1 Tax=Ornithinimicrobium sp. TaxID=1977084 RepID=UPI002B4914EE|nr:helix-turn-helix domain-containing protein [Ornithinimicrobium sp.]HKJ12212.1 helix-turn-helix domain-containing protein [Ornithinimicrobium sp.]